jgi:hypothetical protein
MRIGPDAIPREAIDGEDLICEQAGADEEADP